MTIPKSETESRIPAVLEAANHVERWAGSLPRWSDDGRETWYAFLDRRCEAEVALIERLRRAPACQVVACPLRRHVDLTLGGISVHTHEGLEAALREWARRARERMKG